MIDLEQGIRILELGVPANTFEHRVGIFHSIHIVQIDPGHIDHVFGQPVVLDPISLGVSTEPERIQAHGIRVGRVLANESQPGDGDAGLRKTAPLLALLLEKVVNGALVPQTGDFDALIILLELRSGDSACAMVERDVFVGIDEERPGSILLLQVANALLVEELLALEMEVIPFVFDPPVCHLFRRRKYALLPQLRPDLALPAVQHTLGRRLARFVNSHHQEFQLHRMVMVRDPLDEPVVLVLDEEARGKGIFRGGMEFDTFGSHRCLWRRPQVVWFSDDKHGEASAHPCDPDQDATQGHARSEIEGGLFLLHDAHHLAVRSSILMLLLVSLLTTTTITRGAVLCCCDVLCCFLPNNDDSPVRSSSGSNSNGNGNGNTDGTTCIARSVGCITAKTRCDACVHWM
jgi:hypothetical protein